jgi:hypothetical protein
MSAPPGSVGGPTCTLRCRSPTRTGAGGSTERRNALPAPVAAVRGAAEDVARHTHSTARDERMGAPAGVDEPPLPLPTVYAALSPSGALPARGGDSVSAPPPLPLAPPRCDGERLPLREPDVQSPLRADAGTAAAAAEVARVAAAEASEEAARAAACAAARSNEWSCATCTTINPSKLPLCQTCANPNTNKAPLKTGNLDPEKLLALCDAVRGTSWRATRGGAADTGHFRGFENMGNTCWMNSALQALASAPSFARTFNVNWGALPLVYLKPDDAPTPGYAGALQAPITAALTALYTACADAEQGAVLLPAAFKAALDAHPVLRCAPPPPPPLTPLPSRKILKNPS